MSPTLNGRASMERTDKWPRVHTCLHDWCPKRSEECQRCDAVLEILKNAARERACRRWMPDQEDGLPRSWRS